MPERELPPAAPSFLHRAAAVATGGLSLAAAMIAYGAYETHQGWLPAWAAVSALYTVAAVGLWRAEPWARSLTLGVVCWGLVSWVQSLFALGPTALSMSAAGGHLVAAGLLWATSCSLQTRHRWSLILAGAALPGAVLFGLAPLQSTAAMAVLLGGAALLFCMASGIARGRTWGLLLAGIAVPMVCCGVWLAPSTVAMQGGHPMLPESAALEGVLLLRFVGGCSAVLAIASVVPFAAPLMRFLRAPHAS